ncbi:MAG: N-acetylglucosamine-6-phosphate deacetylase [Phycicoccus sp.]|nr:N-acetylglucosamine-6-phosphate deacetylase [Phycicoccus sp.]
MPPDLHPAAPFAPAALVDIHCHGALGFAFGDTTAGSREAAAYLAGLGVTRVVASLVSATPQRLADQVTLLAPLVADGTLLGIHLEGPFLADECRGAHDPALLIDPDPALVERLALAAADAGAPGAIKQITFAPELPGAADLIPVLAAFDILPAIGHTAADAATVTRLIDVITAQTARPALITHLFNGMPPMHHRKGGPVAAALAAAARGDAIVELIADGVHVVPEVVRMVFDTLGPQRIALISDAMAATGLGDGDYVLGTLPVRVQDGTARLVAPDGSTGSIAGSTSTLAACVAWAIEVAAIPAGDVLTAATVTPLAVLRDS